MSSEKTEELGNTETTRAVPPEEAELWPLEHGADRPRQEEAPAF